VINRPQRSRDRDKEFEALYETIDKRNIPQHIAIIMDGNGRWAQKRGLPRTYGHRAGAETLREIVRSAADIGVSVLTAYAFSTENWKRPMSEVSFLMSLFSEYLDTELEELCQQNVRLQFIGDINGLPEKLQQKITYTQKTTLPNTGLRLNLAVNYGGRAELVAAVRKIAHDVAQSRLKPECITEAMVAQYLYTAGLPDPELLIRPGGNMRISNFLLWQLAYTEIWVTDVNWPDFTPLDLLKAIADYQRRERRFGGLNLK